MLMAMEDTYPLSPMQQGMLFHYLMDKHAGIDIEQIVGILREDLNISAFKQAWECVVMRHPALRTSIRWEGLEQPMQDVHPSLVLSIEQHDWRDLSPGSQQHQLSVYLDVDRKSGFDISQPPLMRLALFRMSEEDYRFVWSFHHIVLDGRSLSLVLKEVFSFYEAFRHGKDLELGEPRPFKDYIVWLQQRDRSQDETFWRSLLEDFLTPTPLPADRLVVDKAEQQHREQVTSLSGQLTAALQALAKQHQFTLNTIVQCAWAILLSRYSGEEDVVFGATRACRRSVPEAETMIGNLINTLPVRLRVKPDVSLLGLLAELRAQHVSVRDFEHTALTDVQRFSDVSSMTPLFASILVFDHYDLNSTLRAQAGPWENREFRLHEHTGFPLTGYACTVNVYGGETPELALKISYNWPRLDEAAVTRMLDQISNMLEHMVANPEQRVGELPLLTESERHQLLVTWNDTGDDNPRDKCIHQLFEAQVEKSPDAVAIVFQDQRLTYRELNARANQLARRLRSLNVGPEILVGVHMRRSLEMMVAILGIQKAGGAYVPLDPSFPEGRLAYVLKDSGAKVLLTQSSLEFKLNSHGIELLALDREWPSIAREDISNEDLTAKPDNLAYVIYTSGSTGKPKGVMVCHRNVANFFIGMDAHIAHNPPGAWLAVTSLSFDISVLELLWTLARGFTVVLQSDNHDESATELSREQNTIRKTDFSLFYFASEEGERTQGAYRLLLEGAKFADEHGFAALWTPERHFHAFGGIYPNPSVTSAAVAAITQRIRIRAGSVVLPLHNPIRVAEEWALVDNLSKGRVGISFASGWQPDDFVIAPQNYAERKEIMLSQIETVRKLWRGEAVSFDGVAGKRVEIKTLPRPIQPELPVWVTTAGNVETYRMAGELGANVLTHLLGQTVEELGEKIASYQEAWAEAGHAPGQGHVTLMLHTFVGEDEEAVRELVREPMKNYLRSSVGLIKNVVSSFPAFKNRSKDTAVDSNTYFQNLGPRDMEALLDHAFERYFETSGLFGTPQTCLGMIERLNAAGVSEIACLIDFGVNPDIVLEHLPHLNTLKELSDSRSQKRSEDYNVAAQIERHRISHLQCTPSMARMLIGDRKVREALSSLRQLLIGGEAFPPTLAKELKEVVKGEVINMYGPTETTIWSTTYTLNGSQATVPIGRPIVNTQLYILDRYHQLVPTGAVGELYIGGEGVARGYLNRSELTKEKFILNPFSEDPQARLYRTGDMVRYMSSGDIEFLGRSDHQVKIRGHRIELGEIEAVLQAHPEVREAVVNARDDIPGEKRLVAYLVPEKASTPSINELRRFLEQNLPDYMIPAAFITMTALPLTPNMKVDRKALPAPEQERPELETVFVAPVSPVEKAVASFWADALGLERIGLHDNFIELGGDSLAAVEVFFKIQERFQVEFPLQVIFEFPSVAGLSKALEKSLSQRKDISLVFDTTLRLTQTS